MCDSKLLGRVLRSLSFRIWEVKSYPEYRDNSSKTSANFYQTTRRHISEDGILWSVQVTHNYIEFPQKNKIS
jgi:hypothetical protein